MTLTSLGDKVALSPSQQHEAGHKYQMADRAGVVLGMCGQTAQASAYFAAPMVPGMRNLRMAIDSFEGKEVYPGLGAGFGS